LPLRQEDVTIRGHAIECRVYAEDPYADFLPSTGTIVRWAETRLPGVRYESGVRAGSNVTIHYDPMLAKVIAHAPTRREATQKLAKALADMQIDGVRTNVPLLLSVLRHPAWRRRCGSSNGSAPRPRSCAASLPAGETTPARCKNGASPRRA
jgi:acetyl/propionyl-CoA carboxylase alpha subunit